MVGHYITFASAREGQASALETAIGSLREQVCCQRDEGEFEGQGPILVGIGASLAAACAPAWTMRSRGIHAWRLGAGDHPLPFPPSDHPIIGVSQSGRSAETLAVLESVEPRQRYAVVNTQPSPIADVARKTLSLGNIPDSYASTIGYTATAAGLGMIADAWNSGAPDSGWDGLPWHVRRIEQQVGERAMELAATFVGVSTADFVGAGPSLGSAEAGALLFREVARLPATAMGTRQYLHGAMESAGDGVHVVFGGDREIELARTLSAAGHKALLVSTEDVPEAAGLQVIRLPELSPSQRAVLEVVVMQILVGTLAELAGIDVEQFVFHHTDTKVPGDRAAGATA